MNNNRRLIFSAVEIVLGAALVLGVRLTGGDSLWLGMGGALIAVAALQLVFGLRYRADADYREKVDVEARDERSAFLRARAWAWAGYGSVFVGGIATIVFMILGREELFTLCGSGVCLIMVLYWISFLVLKKKY